MHTTESYFAIVERIPAQIARCVAALLCLLVAFAAASQAMAAGAPGSIHGTVTDSSHAVLAGATVRIINTATKASLHALTNRDGMYTVSNLTPGSYQIKVTASGFEVASKTVEVSGAVSVDLMLKVASRSEVLNVVADRPMIGDSPDAPGKKDYLVSTTASGSKVELPDSWVPQTVVSLSAKLLEDENPAGVVGALEDVAGVSNTYPGYYPLDYQGATIIRGFSVSQTLRNGLWDSQSNGNIGWLGSVDHINVVKGPSGLEYGTYWGGIGGVIDIVTKKPYSARAYKINADGDSYGSWGVHGDFSQPINSKWLTRTNLNFSNTEGFARNFNDEKRDGAIIVQGQLSAKDALTLEYERRWQNGGPYSGLPGWVVASNCSNGSTNYTNCLLPFNVSDRWVNLYGPVSHWTYNAHDLHAGYEHRFNSSWKVSWNGSLTRTGREAPTLQATTLSWVTTGTAATGYTNTTKYTETFGDIHMGPERTWDQDALLVGRFRTGRVQHVMDAGYRFSKGGYHMNMFRLPSSIPSTSFTDPEKPVWATVDIGQTYRYVWGDYWEHNHNIYFNDVAALTRKLRVTGGVNYTPSWKSDSGMTMKMMKVTTPPTYTHTKSSDSGQAWRVGGMYDVLPAITVFADYATTFQSQGSNTTQDGTIQSFDPLTGSQVELGVKAAIARRLNLTAAVYKLKESNLLVSDPDPAKSTLGYEAEIGAEHSRGFELDGRYHLGDGWDVLTAYGFTDARVGNTSSYVVGSSMPNVSKETLRVFGTHTFANGFFRGLEAGGGVHAVSRFTTTAVSNSTAILYTLPNYTTTYALNETLPAYATVDAVLGYGFGERYRFTVNVQNLLNHEYITSASSYSQLYPGQPVVATFRLQRTF